MLKISTMKLLQLHPNYSKKEHPNDSLYFCVQVDTCDIDFSSLLSYTLPVNISFFLRIRLFCSYLQADVGK